MRNLLLLLASLQFTNLAFAQSVYEPSGTYCNQAQIAIPPNDPVEHILNGDFEQFCNDLNYYPFTASNRYLPFINPKGQNICESDITGWTVNCAQSNTPDFYLRSDLSPLFPLYKIGFLNFNGNYNLSQPVIGTHKTTSQAFIGLYCHSPMIPVNTSNEELINELHQPLSPGASYNFSFWGITKPIITTNQILNSPSGVALYIGDGTIWHIVINQINISNTHAEPATNDWGFYQRTFTVPNNVNTNLTHIKIVNNSSLTGEPDRETYVMLDDISIKDHTESNFPTYIYSPNYTDLTYQNHLLDLDDNIYVYGTQINGPIKTYIHNSGSVIKSSNSFAGSFIAKYDCNGNLLWDKLYPDLQIKDLELDKDNLVHFLGQIMYSTNYSAFITGLSNHFSNITLPTSNAQIETVLGHLNAQGQIQNAIGSSLPYSNGNVAFDIDQSNNNFSLSLSTSTTGIAFGFTNIPVGHNIIAGFYSSGIPQFDSFHSTAISNIYPNIVETVICQNNSTYIQCGSSIFKLHNSNLTLFANLNSTVLDFQLFDNYLYTLTKDNFNTYTISKHNPTASPSIIKSYTNSTNISVEPSSLAFKNSNIFVIGTLNDGTYLQNGSWVYLNRIFVEKLNSNYSPMWTKYSTQVQSTTYSLKHHITPFNQSNKLFFSSNFFPLTTPWKIQLDNKELLDTGSIWPFGNRNIVLSTIEDFGGSAAFKSNEFNSSPIYPIPSTGNFFFDSKKFSLLEVTNISGSIVPINVVDGAFVISDPVPGIYFVNYKDNLGTIFSSKIVIL